METRYSAYFVNKQQQGIITFFFRRLVVAGSALTANAGPASVFRYDQAYNLNEKLVNFFEFEFFQKKFTREQS